MFLTVAICTRNPRRDYLTRVLQALAGQTVQPSNWELLLVDSASESPLTADESRALGLTSRVVRVSQPGVLLARLAAINEARTPLLLFLDDDNVPAPDFIEHGIKLDA